MTLAGAVAREHASLTGEVFTSERKHAFLNFEQLWGCVPWGVVQMNGRLLRSAAAALRVSLLSGCGALGLLALSAGAATADDGAVQGLLGSVAPVVESVAAPVEPLVQGLTAPVQNLTQDVAAPVDPMLTTSSPAPASSGLLGGVPQLVGTLDLSDAVAPITGVVDSTLAQVPIVNQVVPSGTTTAVTQPLLQSVDSAVAPVLPSVEQVLTPVVGVIAPVVGVVDPAIGVVEPVVDPITGVSEPLAPITGVLQPVGPDNLAPLLDGAANPVGAGAAGDAPGESGQPSEPGHSAAESEQAENSLTNGDLHSSGPSTLGLPSPGADYRSGFSDYQGVRFALQAAPQLVVPVPEPQAEPVALPAAASGAGGASAGSPAPGGAGAADTPAVFVFDLLSATSPLTGDSADLPQGPVFDPGSTPD